MPVRRYTYQCNFSSFYSGILAGVTGGSCQTIIDNPIEVIKIKSMTNQKIMLSELIQNKGFIATLSRNVGFAICISSLCFNKESRSDIVNFGYSSGAGVLGSIITQPFDYVKTQQQRLGVSELILIRIILINYLWED